MQLPEHVLAHIAARATAARSFYLYDTRVMQEKIRGLKKLLPEGVAIYYAMKANPHPAFLKAALAADVAGIEIASLGEAEKAVAAGFSPQRLIYTGPGKAPEELEWSVKNRVRTVHVESLAECHRLNTIAGKAGVTQDILLRVNPNFHIHGAQANFSGDSSKMGVDESTLDDVLARLSALPHLKFRGLHVYAASGVLRVEDLLRNCELVFAMTQKVEQRFPELKCEIIDFGGGFGIDYLETGHDFSPEIYAKGLTQLITRFGYAGRRFVLELGRYLAADSGWYVTEILDIKESLGKKQVVCAGGSHQFRRPVALGINHPLAVVPQNMPDFFEGQMAVEKESVFIGGPLCNSADKLAPKDIYVAAARIGDFAVFGLAGAYGLTMSHLEFLGHARPPEIVLG